MWTGLKVLLVRPCSLSAAILVNVLILRQTSITVHKTIIFQVVLYCLILLFRIRTPAHVSSPGNIVVLICTHIPMTILHISILAWSMITGHPSRKMLLSASPMIVVLAPLNLMSHPLFLITTTNNRTLVQGPPTSNEFKL
jgi:hypothetical protein